MSRALSEDKLVDSYSTASISILGTFGDVSEMVSVGILAVPGTYKCIWLLTFHNYCYFNQITDHVLLFRLLKSFRERERKKKEKV